MSEFEFVIRVRDSLPNVYFSTNTTEMFTDVDIVNCQLHGNFSDQNSLGDLPATISWSDGAGGEGGNITSINFSYSNPGLFNITVSVTDFDGDTWSFGITIRVINSTGDLDGDGISNLAEERIHGTDLLDPDTDGDGFSDGEEIEGEYDPLDPLDHPSHPQKTLLIIISISGGILSTILLVNRKKIKNRTKPKTRA
ncbi:MAG: hypothetical protein ACTSUE_14535 [Promethearchaeota archaeon]